MNLPELKNPFVNAKVQGSGVSSEKYIQNEKRGSKDFVMSRSELCLFAECPSKWIRGVKKEGTDATEWGSLIDCLVMTPEDFQRQYAVTPATYPADKGQEKPWNWNANFCKEWREKQGGKITITPKEYENAQAAISRIKDHDEIAEYIRCSERQVYVTADYIDPATGLVIPVKVLIDLVPDASHIYFGKGIGDFKTARSAKPKEWRKQVFEHNYHTQGAMHLDVYVAATGEDRVEFRHIIQENTAPYQTARRILSSEFEELGRGSYQEALRLYAKCLSENHWPDYDEDSRENINGWQIVQPEPWMIQQIPQQKAA